MKTSNFKQALRGLLLIAIASMPGFALADADTVQAINNMNQNLGNLLQNQVGDLTRNQQVAALINYEAAARIQEYQYNQQLLFMVAPGSNWALKAGDVVGASNNAAIALNIANKGLVNNLGLLTKATKLTLNGTEYPVDTISGPLQYYQQLQAFVQGGDTTNISSLDPSSILLSDNLTKSSPPISQTQAQNLVNIITNPFPYIDPDLQNKIKNGTTLTGADMENIANSAAQYAVVGVSVAALSDIVARRVPAQNQTQSIMDIMDQYSGQRFVNPDWYTAIGAASDTALLREIAHMEAFKIWLAYEQFRISEQQLALMASLNAVMAKMNIGIQQFTQQMQSATAQAKSSQLQLQQLQKNRTPATGGTSSGTTP